MRILLASNNPGKLRELRHLLADLPIEVVRPSDRGLDLDVAETGQTYAENAQLKALAFAAASGLPALADDSGLEVDALNGAPGLYAARYAGPGASPEDRWRKLLAALSDVPWEQRTARFRAVVALARPAPAQPQGAEIIASAEGVCPGIITLAPAGSGGFGYDPVFYLLDHGCTMAQLPEDAKNQVSHRARAVQALRPALITLAGEQSSRT